MMPIEKNLDSEKWQNTTYVKLLGLVKVYVCIQVKALVAWSSDIVSVCRVMGREIESRQAIGW
jgi:hypothetical protein